MWINVVPPDGVPRRVAAYSGESLLEVFQRNKVPGIHPDCEGGDGEHTMKPFQIPFDYYSSGVSCGQCSVHIPDPWFEKLNRIPSTEENVLEKRETPNSSFSRLACCVQVRPELNEMIVAVGDNQGVNGDWFTGNDPFQF